MFYEGFTKCPNYYSGILKVSTGILKENVCLIPNTCNLPEVFSKDFLLIFLPGVYVNFLIGLDMLMILSFLFHPILTFSVSYLWSIRSIAVFNLLWKLKTTILFRFLMFYFQKTLTGSQWQWKSFSVCLLLHALSNHPLEQKMATFYVYVYRASHICSDPSNLSNELNYLKPLALPWGHNPSVIDKAWLNSRSPSTLSDILTHVLSCSFAFLFVKLFQNL